MGYAARRLGACWGFDSTYRFISSTVAKRVFSTSMVIGASNVGPPVFAIRYVSLSSPNFNYDISPTERDVLFEAGCKYIGLVQHVEYPHWVANPQAGSQHGKAAATHARLVSYPADADLAPDIEGVGQGDVAVYLHEWLKPVQDAGFNTYGGNFYDGYADLLSLPAKQGLYADRTARKFWKDFGPRQAVPGVGWAMIQHAQQMHAGVEIDADESRVADDGDCFSFMAVAAGDPVAPDPGDPVAAGSDPT
jgi:hypothetical protein